MLAPCEVYPSERNQHNKQHQGADEPDARPLRPDEPSEEGDAKRGGEQPAQRPYNRFHASFYGFRRRYAPLMTLSSIGSKVNAPSW